MEALANRVVQVHVLIEQLAVPMVAVELYRFLELFEDELRLPLPETFTSLVETGFSVWGDRREADNYYQGTADYVHDALERNGLLVQ